MTQRATSLHRTRPSRATASTPLFRVHASTSVRRLFAELGAPFERASYVVGQIDGESIYLDSPFGPIMNGTSRRVTLDLAQRDAALDWCHRSGRFCLVASVHTHPQWSEGEPGASSTDVGHWKASAEAACHPFAGVILAPGSPQTDRWDCDPWRNPKMRCWVALPDLDAQVPVLPADLTVEYER